MINLKIKLFWASKWSDSSQDQIESRSGTIDFRSHASSSFHRDDFGEFPINSFRVKFIFVRYKIKN